MRRDSTLRPVAGTIAGFFIWTMAWFGGEKLLAGVWPQGFGVHQRAFEAALTNGGAFTPDTTHLVLHIALAALVSLIAGFLAATIAKNQRAPLFLGILLTAFGLLKAGMSWSLVPLWYHVAFTALLLPMTVSGSRLRSSTTPPSSPS